MGGLEAGCAGDCIRASHGYSSWRSALALPLLSSNLLSVHAIDLHPGNIVLVDPTISKKSADDILRSMDPPMTSEIRGGSHFPQYLVLPSTLLFSPILSDNCKVKLIDFGSAFLSGGPSPKMRCPLPFRAPEAVMTGSWDVEADIWSLGCTVRKHSIREFSP